MGRGSGFILGLLGLALPGFLFYLTPDTGSGMMLFGMGFVYSLLYLSNGSTTTELDWINRDWLSPDWWPGNPEFYLYIASFALAVLGLIVLLGSAKGGAILLLLAGLVNLGWMILMYNNFEDFLQIFNMGGYPIPVGAIFLILAGFFGRND